MIGAKRSTMSLGGKPPEPDPDNAGVGSLYCTLFTESILFQGTLFFLKNLCRICGGNGDLHMKNEKTTLFTNGLIWFGAGVSISEILTGTYFAPLGFSKGIAAIITGHIIGCILLFLAGVIGGKTGKSAAIYRLCCKSYGNSTTFSLYLFSATTRYCEKISKTSCIVRESMP